MRHDDDHGSLRADLSAALARCKETVADYRAGLLDDRELGLLLLDRAVVTRGDEAWVLDLDGEHWLRWVRRQVAVRSKEDSQCDEL